MNITLEQAKKFGETANEIDEANKLIDLLSSGNVSKFRIEVYRQDGDPLKIDEDDYCSSYERGFNVHVKTKQPNQLQEAFTKELKATFLKFMKLRLCELQEQLVVPDLTTI